MWMRLPVGRPRPSSAVGMSSGDGHEDASELGLDTMVDVLSQLKNAPDTKQPS
jgi:hypothetical protein